MRCYRPILALVWQCIALLFAVPAALFAVPAAGAETHIAAELIVESPASPGGETTVAILMRPAPGWHGYWLNPGDAGLGMTLKWRVPEGAMPGPPRYPVPRTLTIAGLMNHVYESDYAVLASLTLPAGAAPGTAVPLELEADWLACTDEICVPEHALLRAEARVAASGQPAVRDPRFDEWRRRLPAPLGAEARFALDAQRLRIAIPLPAKRSADRSSLLRRAGQSGRLRGGADIRQGGRSAGGRNSPGQVRPGQPRRHLGCAAAGAGQGRRAGDHRATGQRAARWLAARRARRRAHGVLALAAARRAGRRAAAQRDALRLSDPQPQGAEPRPRRRKPGRGAARGAGLYRRRRARLRRARGAAAGLARGRTGSRLGVPVAGARGRRAAADARRGDYRQSGRAVRIRRARLCQRRLAAAALSPPGCWRLSWRRPAPVRSWRRRWARRCCCRSWRRCCCSPRWGWASPCPSSPSP